MTENYCIILINSEDQQILLSFDSIKTYKNVKEAKAAQQEYLKQGIVTEMAEYD